MPLVECVPNFSEGQDPTVLRALRSVVEEAPGASLLDASQDADHHRAVVTFVAEAERAVDVGLALAAVAVERIDLGTHAGVHPRIGALDVFPFVPLERDGLADCAALARQLAAGLGERLRVPAFLYGHGAPRELPELRRGGLQGLARRMAEGLVPDGPSLPLHPSAGAVAVGARPFLVAFNVVLDTNERAVAADIAREVRERDGGLPAVRALGLELASRGRVQVSMNLVDHARTDLVRAFDEVVRRAAERGVEVLESELIGCAPEAALDERVAAHVRLVDFDPNRQVLERRIAAAREALG